VFRQADPGVPADDDLLAELGRDAVATVRAAQDELVRAPLDRLLIIQGGPGTGKTITALRRVAWLLDEGLLDDAETLVVGPSAAFARYTDDVLTGWGYDRVAHRSVTALLPDVPVAVDEVPHVTRLKGEARMARLLARAFEERPGSPSPGELPESIEIEGRTIRLDPVALRRVIDTARASEAAPIARRILLRATLVADTRDPRLVLEAADRVAERLCSTRKASCVSCSARGNCWPRRPAANSPIGRSSRCTATPTSTAGARPTWRCWTRRRT
jgi:hypothetical protein